MLTDVQGGAPVLFDIRLSLKEEPSAPLTRQRMIFESIFEEDGTLRYINIAGKTLDWKDIVTNSFRPIDPKKDDFQLK